MRDLRLGRADLFGYALGGGSCLRCAIQHRDLVWDGSMVTDMHLAIVPGLTHYNIFQAPQQVPVVDAFS